jgi:3-oxoacyl-[acyl-carrier-protein] synthase-3
MNVGVIGLACGLADRVVPNSDFEAIGLNDEWIARRTGMVSRRWYDPDRSLADVAIEISRGLVGVGTEVDGLLLVSTTSGQTIPPLAPMVATALGLAETAFVLDLNAACSGFIQGLTVANCLIEAGRCTNVLVCCVEASSRMIEKTDRSTAILFGDGAGAVLLAHRDDFAPMISTSGGDGSNADIMHQLDPIGVHLDGVSVYLHGVRRMTDIIEDLVARQPRPTAIIAHQANGRILDTIAENVAHLGLPVINRIAEAGNTLSASIPLALAAALSDGELPTSGRLALTAYGAGEIWGGIRVDYALGSRAEGGEDGVAAGSGPGVETERGEEAA